MTRGGGRALAGLVALAAWVAPVALTAQQTDEASDRVVIGAGEGAGGAGRLAVNIAAGSQNQQASSAILALGDVALTHGSVVQISPSDGADRTTSIVVEDGAFAGTDGLTSLNITAGTQNQSANLASFAIGRTGALSDQLLMQSRAPTQPSVVPEEASATRNDSVAVGDGAFAEGSGVFQANLIGGERNSSANTFSLSVSAGGQP